MAILGFKERARRHQIKFREEVLKVGYNGFETILNDTDAQKGLIFFDGFKINEYAQNLKEANKIAQLHKRNTPEIQKAGRVSTFVGSKENIMKSIKRIIKEIDKQLK